MTCGPIPSPTCLWCGNSYARSASNQVCCCGACSENWQNTAYRVQQSAKLNKVTAQDILRYHELRARVKASAIHQYDSVDRMIKTEPFRWANLREALKGPGKSYAARLALLDEAVKHLAWKTPPNPRNVRPYQSIERLMPWDSAIKVKRVNRGLTGPQLAHEIGEPYALLQKVEERTKPAPMRLATNLAEYYYCLRDDLFDGDGYALTLRDSEEYSDGQLSLGACDGCPV